MKEGQVSIPFAACDKPFLTNQDLLRFRIDMGRHYSTYKALDSLAL